MLELNKIYCGDCLELMDSMEDESVDLIITDPPFFVLKQNKKLEKCEWDNFTNIEDFMDFTKKWIEKCYRVLKDNSQVYTFWSQMWQKEFWNMEQPFEIKRMLIWENPCKTKGFTSQMYLWNYTPVFFLTKGKIERWNASFLKKENVDIFRFPAPQTNWNGENKQLHFLQKPLRIIEIFINNSSNEKDVVLDPFLGSGTIAVACLKLNRKFIGFEKSKKYVNIAEKRIEPYLKQRKLNNFLLDKI
jgi:DNA modification methylase